MSPNFSTDKFFHLKDHRLAAHVMNLEFLYSSHKQRSALFLNTGNKNVKRIFEVIQNAFCVLDNRKLRLNSSPFENTARNFNTTPQRQESDKFLVHHVNTSH